MTSAPASTPGTGLVDGVDLDAVAAVVRSCPGVSALDGGRFGQVASYLPGRVVQGVAVDNGRVRVQVRSRWGVPVPEVAAEIRERLLLLAGTLPVDVSVADVDDPPADPGLPPADPGLPPPAGPAILPVPQPGSE